MHIAAGKHSLEFGFWCAEDAVVIIELRAAVARVLELHAVQVQVLLLHLWGRFCGVLLRIQNLHTHTQTQADTFHGGSTAEEEDDINLEDRNTHLIWDSEALQQSHDSLLKVLLLKHKITDTQPQVSDLVLIYYSNSQQSNTEKTATLSTGSSFLVILPAVDTFAVSAEHRFRLRVLL